MFKPKISFEKISYDQFKKDVKKFEITGDALVFSYDIIRIPTRSTEGSAGYDFATPVDVVIKPGETVMVPTGIRAIFPPGYVLNIYVRSSVGTKKRITLTNGTGIIDSDYQYGENEGHIWLPLQNLGNEEVTFHMCDNIAQGIFTKYYTVKHDRARGVRTGGFGSTGK